MNKRLFYNLVDRDTFEFVYEIIKTTGSVFIVLFLIGTIILFPYLMYVDIVQSPKHQLLLIQRQAVEFGYAEFVTDGSKIEFRWNDIGK